MRGSRWWISFEAALSRWVVNGHEPNRISLLWCYWFILRECTNEALYCSSLAYGCFGTCLCPARTIAAYMPFCRANGSGNIYFSSYEQ